MNNYIVRFIPLGGIVGVTKNMYVYELYKSKVKTPSFAKASEGREKLKVNVKNTRINPEEYKLQDILIVDCGIGFPEAREMGVDFVIPDIDYLKDKTDKIRAILLSHGHEDHITALPYHYDALGKPPLYTSKLTGAFIQNKFKEFNKTPNVQIVEYGKQYQFGGFRTQFINITHSIPDAMHILINTPVGNFYHGPDYKFDLTPPYGKGPDFYAITKAGHDGVLCLLSDSLGAEREGLTLSEAIVGKTFEDEMRTCKGKFIMTTFSSNISRINQCVEAAIKFNRKIVFLGRSMKENTDLAKDIGYLRIPQNLIGRDNEVMKSPPNRICLIVAGSQGQYMSALSKLASDMNKNIKIKYGDKVIFSSDPIPGNENEVYGLIEELAMKGADVVYSDINDQLHASGHGSQEDLKFLMRFTNPRYMIPIGGTIRHQRQYQKLAMDLGYESKNILTLKEGETVIFEGTEVRLGEVVDTKQVYVDAYGVGDVGNVVLRDRLTLAEEGMVVAVITIDKQGRLANRPKVITRGFVFEKTESVLLESAVKSVEKSFNAKGESIADLSGLKKKVATQMEQFFYEETGRRPLLMVEMIEV